MASNGAVTNAPAMQPQRNEVLGPAGYGEVIELFIFGGHWMVRPFIIKTGQSATRLHVKRNNMQTG
jgi:hypothetical protein